MEFANVLMQMPGDSPGQPPGMAANKCISKPPKVIRIVSLLVLFVKFFFNHSVKVNLVSLSNISFYSFLTQTATVFRVA